MKRTATALLFAATLILLPYGSALASVTMGETSITPNSDSGNANLLLAQKATLAQAATVQSISFYVTSAAGSVRLGIYNAAGPGGGPGGKIAETASFAPVTGWNTTNVTKPVSFPAGTYWIAYLTNSNSLGFKNAQTGTEKYYSFTYGVMPATFATAPTTGTFHFSLYATLNTTPDTTAPSTPTNLAAKPLSTSQIALSWATSTDNVAVAGYKVFRNSLQVATTTNPNYNDSGLIASTTYSYKVAAFDAALNVSSSSLSVATTTLTPPPADTQAPSVPANLLTAPVSASQINLTWSASTDNVAVAGYTVFRNGVFVASSTVNSFADAGLLASTTYSYAVSAFDAAGNVSVQSTSTATTTPTAAVALPGAPTLMQHVASSANPLGLGISGNNFKIPLPNAVGGGDCLVLGMTYPQGSTPTVTDNNGNVWPLSAAVTANAGAGGNVSSIYVLPNALAGVTTVTVSFAAPVIPFNYTVSEFNNIAAVNPVSGTSSVANAEGAAISSPSFTPGNNNANGGNLMWSYYAVSGSANSNPTTWTAGTNYTLLDADIAWISKQGFPHASQYYVQASSTTVTPSITAVGDTVDGFNGVTIALKAASGGATTSPSIHINKIMHQTTNIGPSSVWTLQEPTTGNLRVLATANGNNLTNITSVTDSDNSVWTKIEPQADEPQIWYSANTTSNQNLKVTMHVSGASPTLSALFYDISNASTSPLDSVAGSPTVDVGNMTSLVNTPTITPTTSNGLVIAVVGLGQGPGLGLASTSPAGAQFDLVTYTGEFDVDLMENADGQAHVYYATTATQNWNWNISATSPNSAFSTAAAFKSAH